MSCDSSGARKWGLQSESLIAGTLAIALLAIHGCSASRCESSTAIGNLGPAVNSPFDDYAPSLIDSATLIFSSTRTRPGESGLRDVLEQEHSASLYFSMRLGQAWDVAARYRIILNSAGEINGTLSFAPESSPFGAMACVSVCAVGSPQGCDLFALVPQSGGALVNLGQPINTTAWEGHPFVERDRGRLWFASDRTGGLGGTDIWYCDRTGSGTWGTPVNAGPAVNSLNDELSPCVDPESGTLYFAAWRDGSGLDIMYLKKGMVTRTALTAPYNSPDDDFTPFIFGSTFYLASTRAGGCGGFDLYGFPKP